MRLVMADVPYGIRRKNNYETMGRTSIDYPWDGGFDTVRLLECVRPKLAPGGSVVLWHDWKYLGVYTEHFHRLGYEVKRPIVLKKKNPWPRNISRLPVQAVELACWAVKEGAPWIFNPKKPYETFVFEAAVPRVSKGWGARHEALKPAPVYASLIELLTNPGDLVLDPCAGQGTTAVVCEALERKSVSFELDPTWYDETVARLKGEYAVT